LGWPALVGGLHPVGQRAPRQPNSGRYAEALAFCKNEITPRRQRELGCSINFHLLAAEVVQILTTREAGLQRHPLWLRGEVDHSQHLVVLVLPYKAEYLLRSAVDDLHHRRTPVCVPECAVLVLERDQLLIELAVRIFVPFDGITLEEF